MDELNKTFFQKALASLKSKKTVLVIFLILVLSVIAAAAFMIFSGKSAYRLYMEAEGKNFERYIKQIKEAYADFYEAQKPYMENSYRSRLELTAEAMLPEQETLGITDAAGIAGIIKNCKLISDSRFNPTDNVSSTQLLLQFNKMPLADAGVISRDSILGFSVPVLLPDRYFTINMDRADDVYDRFNIPVRPVRFIKMPDIASAIVFSSEELDNIFKEYASLAGQLIPQESVTFGESVDVSLKDTTVRGREVIVTLDGAKTQELLRELIKKTASDNTLINMTYGNLKDISDMLDEAAFFQLFELLDSQGWLKLDDFEKGMIEALDIEKSTDAFTESIKKLAGELQECEGLNMKLVIDNSGAIIQRQAEIDGLVLNNSIYSLNISSGANENGKDGFDNGYCSLTVNRVDSEGAVHSDFLNINTWSSDGKGSEGSRLLELEFIRKINDIQDKHIKLGLDMKETVDTLTARKNRRAGYDIKISADNPEVTDRIYGDITTEYWDNKKQQMRSSNTTVSLNLEMPSFKLEPAGLVFKIAREDRFNIGDFDLPEISSSNTIDLNNITDDELKRLESELITSAGMFYFKNKSIFDTVMK